ncbi:siderophore biosynthesis protein SbnG [Paenibacillus sp. PR3]|uniref:Siderophore biosynthesis protein SbnG n=1 Tax=Paenibacillus terricola TaxID=2763503 RepID=A0ABR8MTG2_9BACL|nr:aldolase/citrate lyase family protein [Paenibacillus terricola]MBD3919256.1 siderophore biosynthesis protein SbnG [Paenibacillus terricola]
MRKNKLKEKIARRKSVFGLFVSIPNPIIIEMIGHAEYDFVIIDFEHASTNVETVEELIRAAELLDMTPLVRISSVNRMEITKFLDSGAQGIVIPHVERRDQVEEAVRYAFYHPLGNRSLNSGRPGIFAKNSLSNYIEEANREVMIIPMIESIEGAERIRDIVSIPQVSFVLEGAADLSQSLSVPWQTDHPEVQQLLDHVHKESIQQGIPYAAVSRRMEDHLLWAERGVQIFVLGDDRNTAFRAYWNKQKEYRQALGVRS